MRTEALHLKLQGLWVGAALGELYANGWFRESLPLQEKALVAQSVLPHTSRLCLLATRWLNTAGDINADLWHCQRSQNSLLNALPLFFLDSTLYESLPPANAELETASSSIAILKTLDWLQRDEPLEYLLSYLLQSPILQDTPLAENLGEVYEHLSDRKGLPPQTPKEGVLPPKTTADGIAQVLYLLLSSPNDFCLTVRRSGLILNHQPELQILLAALSGFHNGLIQLPLEWRLQLQTIQSSTTVPLEHELQTLGNRCAAQWAGAYAPRVNPDWSKVAVAASGQLRPR